MLLAVLIIVVVVAAIAMVLLTANRRRAATGALSRETRKRDEVAHGEAPAESATGTELEVSAQARARADEARGGDVARRSGGTVTVWEPVDEEELGVTRRQFLNRGILSVMLVALGGFGASLLAFLWPSSSGGFGGSIAAGKLADIQSFMTSNLQPFYVPEARTYIQPYPIADVPAAKASKA